MQPFSDLKRRFWSVRTLASFLLAFFIIYLLLHKLDFSQVLGVVRQTNPWLYAGAAFVYYLAFPVRGLRFRIMLKAMGRLADVRDLARIILISWFANCLVPAKLGDVFRGYLVKRNFGASLAQTVGIIFAERVYDLFILYLLIGATGLMAFHGRIPGTMTTVLSAGFAFLAAIFAVLVFMRYGGDLAAARFPKKFRDLYRRFAAGTLSSFRSNGRVAGLTAVVWLLEGLSFDLVTRAIGINLPLPVVIFTGLMSALLTALPITPAGLGFVETAKVGILVYFHLDSSLAVSAALLDRVISYWSLLLVGLMVYWGSERKQKQSPESDQPFAVKEGAGREGHDHYSHV